MRTIFPGSWLSSLQLQGALAILLIASSALGVVSAQTANDIRQVLDRGPNSSRVQRTWSEVDPKTGEWVQRESSYTQLEDGLNYFDPDLNAWAESRELIELAPGGAVARYGRHRAVFSSNANDPQGAIDFEVDHQIRLRASPLALRYFNPVDGRSVVIATIQDAQGELLPPNQVIWRNVFDNVSASLIVTVRRAGLESDVILHEVPPAPEEFGMPSEVARLEVVTEFFDPPQPVRRNRVLAAVDDPLVRARVAEPDWIDEELDFGPNRIGAGRAFAWSQREAALDQREEFSPVGKRWTSLPNGRHFLIESVEVIGLLDELLALPGKPERVQGLRQREAVWAGQSPAQIRHAAMKRYAMAPRSPNRRQGSADSASVPLRPRPTSTHAEGRPALLASTDQPEIGGLVIDWVSMSSGASAFTFRGDETYHVTGYASFYSGLTLEGGSVIKFPAYTNGSGIYPSIAMYGGAFQCKTSPYRPAVFTAECDNTAGESIFAGSPNATNSYGYYHLYFQNTGSPITVEHVRVKNAYFGIYFYGTNLDCAVRHSQILNCLFSLRQYGTNTPFRIQNTLVSSARTGGAALYLNGGEIYGEHLTIVDAANLMYSGSIRLTNSVVAGLASTNYGFSGVNNFLSNSSAGLFSAAGSGFYYLPTASPLRNAGTTNLTPVLAADLRKLTTTGPSILASPITSFTQLQPQVSRDTDLPDLGYHYPPLDYAVSGLVVSNALLSLTNGVALAAYGSTGLTLQSGAQLLARGAPHNLVRIVRCNTVQESVSSWATNGSFDLIQLDSPTAAGTSRPSIDLQYTDLAHLAVTTNSTTARRLIASGSNAPLASLSISHSQIRGLHLDLGPSASAAGNTTVLLANNVFEQSGVSASDPSGGAALQVLAHNNLFLDGSLSLLNSETATWDFLDNLVATGPLAFSGTWCRNNGFRAGLTTYGSNIKASLTLDFVAGPLGRYYYPTNGGATSLTNLVNTGSRPAPDAGLYHHTVRVDQAKEAGTTVDIGFHYVAVNANGSPIDTDGDGWPDYFEDRNGNGTVDSGETDWNVSNSGLGNAPATLLLFTPLK